MPTPAPRPAVCLRWLLATSLGACVGTPTPEPPDNLPRPDDTRIFGLPIAVDLEVTPVSLPPITIQGEAGAVVPDSELWVVNLDNPAVEPLTLRATELGSFEGKLVGQLGDRVRLVSRTESQHSL